MKTGVVTLRQITGGPCPNGHPLCLSPRCWLASTEASMSESISDGGAVHAAVTFPHPGGCWGCERAGTCNVCGTATRAATGRCTNGRCPDCHRTVCTPGGATEGGHGYGSFPARLAAAERNRAR